MEILTVIKLDNGKTFDDKKKALDEKRKKILAVGSIKFGCPYMFFAGSKAG